MGRKVADRYVRRRGSPGWGAFRACRQPQPGIDHSVGAQRGTEVEVTFNGARLADAQEILFYSPGIAVTGLEAADNAVKTKLAIAADCRLGQHAMRVRTASGTSELRTFYVGASARDQRSGTEHRFCPAAEDRRSTRRSTASSRTKMSIFSVIEAKKGERITAEIEGIRLGYSFFDPYVAILDKQRFELATFGRCGRWCGKMACAAVVAPEDGSYVIQVRETAYGGNGSCMYRLHVGRFPRPARHGPRRR